MGMTWDDAAHLCTRQRADELEADRGRYAVALNNLLAGVDSYFEKEGIDVARFVLFGPGMAWFHDAIQQAREVLAASADPLPFAAPVASDHAPEPEHCPHCGSPLFAETGNYRNVEQPVCAHKCPIHGPIWFEAPAFGTDEYGRLLGDAPVEG